MRVLMARFTLQAEFVQEFAAARKRILSALAEAKPEGVRYTWCAMADGRSFVGWLELEEGVENPLPGMECGREFLRQVPGWVAAPPIREEWMVIGAYPSATRARLERIEMR